jgi:hypothetical protein
MIKELTKEQKLKVLNKVLKDAPDGDYYLCRKIAFMAILIECVTNLQFRSYSTSSIAVRLIPELLQFKPGDMSIYHGWFNSAAERTEALKKLIKIIEEQ